MIVYLIVDCWSEDDYSASSIMLFVNVPPSHYRYLTPHVPLRVWDVVTYSVWAREYPGEYARVTLVTVLVSSCSASADPDPVSKLQYPCGPQRVRCEQSRVKCQAWLIVTNSEDFNWGCQRNFAVIFFILKFEIADFQRGKGLLRIMDNVKVTVKFCWHLQFKSFERCLLCLLWEVFICSLWNNIYLSPPWSDK